MKYIINTSWKRPVRLMVQCYENTGNGGPKYEKKLTSNQELILEIFQNPSMPANFRVCTAFL